MNYGKGAAPSIAGVALLPFTGNNGILFIVAASLIALGVAVFAVSLVLARKSRQTSAN
jgi:hypothetical protein